MFLFLSVNILVFVSSFSCFGLAARCLLFGALSADAFVVELLLIDDVAVYHLRLIELWSLFIKQVNHLAAFLAKEVNVWGGVAIVADSMVVNRDHLCRSVLAHHSQRVVNGGLAERRDCFT